MGKIWALLFGVLNLYAQENKLINVFFHPISLHQTHHLEKANLVLYFDKKPQFEMKEIKNNKRSALVITFKNVSLEENLQEKIKKIQATLPQSMQISCSRKGDNISLYLTFDPQTILVECDSFTAITRNNSFLVRFLDKTVLDKIKNQDNPLMRTAYHGKPAVIIDCGHGGKDAGACAHNLQESVVVLDIGRKLFNLLHQEGHTVLLTRQKEETVQLDERTAFANKFMPMIFISLHANASLNAKTKGIEVFYSSPDLFTNCYASDYHQLLVTHLSERSNKAYELAHHVHNNLKTTTLLDRGIKKAASNILIGVHSPSILIEVAFITNNDDAKLLKTESFRDAIAQVIAKGISSYIYSC